MKKQQVEPLVNDLRRVLEYEIEFSGSFAVSKVMVGCPNPGLDVDGVGPIPLPLTAETAKSIASIGHQAPYGRGMDTVVDTTVRDTIQIDASDVRFKNPKWTPAIQNWVENEVWSGLGCMPFTDPPRCELYKLLLYKPGAHFLPHQDTEKAPGMFATLVVVLPSEFTGGEIHVSHGDESKVFDSAKDSAFETQILAWYTDVTHEVKEITSGYRLALSYHLINTSPGIGPPRMPSGDSCLQHLREIFSKWANGGYQRREGSKAIAYAFTHEYSRASLRETIFKGNDQDIVSIFKLVGDEEGVLVLKGWLNAHIVGSTGDDGWQVYDAYNEDEGPEYGRDRGTEESPVMSHVFETKFWVKDLEDIQGRGVGISKIMINNDDILPYKPFRGVAPDESTLEPGYWGNEGASVEFMYRCAALVILPKREQLSVMLDSEGPDWALEELEKSKSEGPSKENREIVGFLANHKREDITTIILKVAIEWDDAAVWDSIVMLCPISLLGQSEFTDLRDGWEAFKLDGVRETFEKLFQLHDTLEKDRMRFLLFVKKNLPFGEDPKKDEWITTQSTRMMETFNPRMNPETTKTFFMDIILWRGLHFASTVVLPRFFGGRGSNYDASEFALGLVRHKGELVALPEAEGQTVSNTELLDRALDKILGANIPRLSLWGYGGLDAVISLLSICIPGNRVKPYGDLLRSIASSDTKPIYTRYQDLYRKIIPKLVTLLGENGISVSSSPSREFFRDVIGEYLQEVLGFKEESPYLKLSMLTCGHEACSRANDFLRSEETRKAIRSTEAYEIGNCIINLELDGRYRLLTTGYRYGEEPCRELIKSHEAEAAQNWSVRLADTRGLLESIGTDDEISQIMGERYADVEKALEGSQAFVFVGTGKEPEKEDAMVGIE